MTRTARSGVSASACVAILVLVGIVGSPGTAADSRAPKYVLDLTWPQLPLPERWVLGAVGGVCVDSRDHVFILNRQDLVDEELDAGRMAPPVIEFDPDGRVVNSWRDPGVWHNRPWVLLHDCHVDPENNVWLLDARSGIAQKFSHDGSRLLLQIGKTDVFDSSDGTAKGTPLNSALPQFNQPSSIVVDKANGDIYVADGETARGNNRIAVLDSSGRFLRQWRLHRTEAEQSVPQVPHVIRLAHDRLVYVGDRAAHRIQVFDTSGVFKKNIDVPWKQYTPHDGKRRTGAWGSASWFDFSSDPAQRYLFVVNEDNEQIEVLDRKSGTIVSTFGHGAGHFPGQFTHAHGIAVDSKGNVYVAEVNQGKRVQRFKPITLAP